MKWSENPFERTQYLPEIQGNTQRPYRFPWLLLTRVFATFSLNLSQHWVFMSLMVSISGIRGIVGDSLVPEVVQRYVAGFAEYCKLGPIVVGRDGRSTGPKIDRAVVERLCVMGCDVVSLGVVPTPTVALAVEHLGAAGGIAITASHNPGEWNGLKFISSTGMFLDAEENKRFWALAAKQTEVYVGFGPMGRHAHDGSFLQKHVDLVFGLPYLSADAIRARKFTVVVDAINAAGGLIVPQMLRALGCRVIEMNCDASGTFARPPEPIPENLGALCRTVMESGADLGIAVDPDVDRLVLITEKGEPFGEEYTITAVVRFLLEKSRSPGGGPPPPVVVNLSTTRAVDDVVKAFGGAVLRTPVGEINVAARMKAVGALVGGEGSGGVIVPALHYGRDAIVGIGIVLQQLAEFGGTLSALKATLPQYVIVKSKVEVTKERAAEVLDFVLQKHKGKGTTNMDDGLKIDFPDSWVHLRRSNTEPIIRIIAEAPNAARAQALVDQFHQDILQD